MSSYQQSGGEVFDSLQALTEKLGDGPYWVFAYGSLAHDSDEKLGAAERVVGVQAPGRREFCVWSRFYRGTPKRPGLVLGLVHGGSENSGADAELCKGVAIRLKTLDDLRTIDEREMIMSADMLPVYQRVLIPCRRPDGTPLSCICYYANPALESCERGLSTEETIERISTRSGGRGPNHEYCFNSVEAIRDLGILDPAGAPGDRTMQAVYDGVKARVAAGRCAKRVCVPLPLTDFDPTEAAVPWQALTDAGHFVVFATVDATVAAGDDRMVNGTGLPFLFRPMLRANADGRRAYAAMVGSYQFQHPIKHEDILSGRFDALLLPGGHAKGMRPYLESKVLQTAVVEYFKANRIVAAVCHGTLLAGRSIDDTTSKSVLYGRKTTGLLKSQELTAHNLVRLWLGDYYLTYDITVQDELESLLKEKTDFVPGPTPFLRDTPTCLTRGFTVRDGNYLSARWPGDAHRLGAELVGMLAEGQ